MTTEEENTKEFYSLRTRHTLLHAQVGIIASGWAMLEFQINQCIWLLADLNPVAGGCITAQIVPLGSRIDCLLALMKLRSIDGKWIRELNAFKQVSYGTGEKRNRLIHDPVVYDRRSGGAGQIEITAKGTPVYRVKTVDLKEIEDLHLEITKRLSEFGDIRNAILAARETLPKIPAPEADPMQVTFVLDTGSQSSDKK